MPELTAQSTRRRQYKDVSLTFAKNPVTGDVNAVVDDVAIKRSLRMLLLSREGETPFYPNFGSRIHRLLFEPAGPVTELLLQNEISATIKMFEPRVNIQTVEVLRTSDELGYNINMVFNVVNSTEPVTLTLYLSRLR